MRRFTVATDPKDLKDKFVILKCELKRDALVFKFMTETQSGGPTWEDNFEAPVIFSDELEAEAYLSNVITPDLLVETLLIVKFSKVQRLVFKKVETWNIERSDLSKGSE